MIATLVVVGAYVLLVGLVLFVLARTSAVDVAPDPDWLWSQPTDCLSDAAVDARFTEIVTHFRVRS